MSAFCLEFLYVLFHFVEFAAVVVSFSPQTTTVLLQLGIDPAKALQVLLELEHSCLGSNASIHEGVGSIGNRLVYRLISN